VFTAPNADPGSAAMRARIERFVAERPWARFRDTLGLRLYANAMRLGGVMLGNSSSGIVEAGLYGLPVIDVGRRQEGRARGGNVHTCPSDAAAISRLLAELGRPVERPRGEGSTLYGDGHAAPRIAALITDLPEQERLLAKHISTETPQFIAPWERGEIRAVGS
jgi:UDP-N-acetylglucosamine 2-epimerase